MILASQASSRQFRDWLAAVQDGDGAVLRNLTARVAAAEELAGLEPAPGEDFGSSPKQSVRLAIGKVKVRTVQFE